MTSPKLIGLIPARAGSERVKLKNIRRLRGHPLIAYAITAALESGCFERVVVSTDSLEIAEIAKYYGAEVPFLRPADLATSSAIDFQWLEHLFKELSEGYDAFALLRPTSPFRMATTIQRAVRTFLSMKDVDSIRAVELCTQHPGKMWTLQDNGTLNPFVDQSQMDVAWHAMQYRDLPKVYIQNSSLEIAWAYVLTRYRSREGKTVGAFLTEGYEGFSIDYELDWLTAEILAEKGLAPLPVPARPAYSG